MKVSQVLDFVYSPRTMCFAEADAGDAGGEMKSEAVMPPELELDDVDEGGGGQEEPDDLEDIEFEGRKAKIPKAWKDPLEQGKDYRFKTGKLAEEKRAIEAERSRYTQLIQQAETTLKANQPAKPDPAMLDRMSEKYDPDAYHLQRARWETWAGEMHKAQQERQRLESEENTKAERQRAERKTKAESELVKALPTWRDPAVRAAERAKLDGYLTKTLGVDQDELGELDHDHRLTIGMYKAMLYDQAVEKARARKTTDTTPAAPPAAPTRKVGGGGGNSGGIPKSTDAYIAWRRKGGKM